ncbi:MAG: DUF1761 domain-containing protein [Pseudomonadota bacterium]|nr:DUF1761 domain-containing protein [Pseudomonadota bacterium]
MGPINWLAVIMSATLAFAVGLVWYGPLFGGANLFGRITAAPGEVQEKGRGVFGGIAGALLLQALSALMLAHNFARLGADKLAAKPWLYWMQSGGIAFAFIIPALWISYAHQRINRREALIDAGFWMVVYLAMGTVFWVLR